MVQKLSDAGVPPNQIIQISGHKTVNSLNNYSAINRNQQKQISRTLSNNTTDGQYQQFPSTSSEINCPQQMHQNQQNSLMPTLKPNTKQDGQNKQVQYQQAAGNYTNETIQYRNDQPGVLTNFSPTSSGPAVQQTSRDMSSLFQHNQISGNISIHFHNHSTSNRQSNTSVSVSQQSNSPSPPAVAYKRVRRIYDSDSD